MKVFKILLSSEYIPAAELMFAALRSEFTVVDREPVWKKQTKRLVQIDIPDFPALVLEKVAERKGKEVEEVLHSWIEQYYKGSLGEETGFPALLSRSGVEAKLHLIREWMDLGYTGKEAAVNDLVRRLVSD
jgi:hypothetical protein